MSVIHRAIKAILYPNPMKNARGKYLARTSKNSTYNVRETCESLKNKAGMVDVDAMEYHVKLFFEEMADLLEDGNKINTGYFAAQAQVRGSFDSKGDQYDAKRHSVQIVFSTGHLIRQRASKLKAEILRIESNNYGIRTVTDAQTKSYTDKLVMNRVLVICGEKIKISGDDSTVGLYLIHAESGTEHHFPASTLYQNSNATLMLIVPELTQGSYQLMIVTQYAGKGTLLTEPRSCVYVNLLHAD